MTNVPLMVFRDEDDRARRAHQMWLDYIARVNPDEFERRSGSRLRLVVINGQQKYMRF